MSIRKEIKELFTHLSQNDANIVDGEIDWDFVDTDIKNHLGVDRIIEEMGSIGEYFLLFDSLVTGEPLDMRTEIEELIQSFTNSQRREGQDDINWDFVDTGVMMELRIERIVEEMGSLEQYYIVYDELVDQYLAAEAA